MPETLGGLIVASQEPSRLLDTIEAIYAAALSPENYDAFAEHWDRYVAEADLNEAGGDEIGRHLERAITILDRLHMARATTPDPQAIVDQEAGPAAIIDLQGRIQAVNSLWREQAGNPRSVIWDLFDEQHQKDALRSTLRGLHEISEPRTGFMHFETVETGGVAAVAVRRLPSETRHEDGLYIVQTTQAIWMDSVGDLIAHEFGLTAAELALLKRMTLGESFAGIAEATDRSGHTLKAQSRSIYRKIHASNREDAVRTALQFHILFAGRVTSAKPKPSRHDDGTLTLENGMRIGWTRRGARDGVPVIFLHGMSVGHGMSEAFTAELSRRDLTLICVERPGYGRSDPFRDWRRSVENWAQIFPGLLDAFDLDNAAIATHTSGVLYGCAAAAASERVNGVCALAGGVPITSREMLADYPMQVRMLSRTARISATALRFFLSSSTAYYRSAQGRERMITRTYGTTPSDAAAIATPEVRRMLEQGFDMISEGGFDGFVGDGLRIFGDWSSIVSRMQVPLEYVIGEEDPICPLEWARSFAQRYPHVTVNSVAKAGQLLHHTHPDIVADELLDFVQRTAA